MMRGMFSLNLQCHYSTLTCSIGEASLMKFAREKLQTNDGVDEDHKYDEEGDVKQRNHRHNDTIQHNL